MAVFAGEHDQVRVFPCAVTPAKHGIGQVPGEDQSQLQGAVAQLITVEKLLIHGKAVRKGHGADLHIQRRAGESQQVRLSPVADYHLIHDLDAVRGHIIHRPDCHVGRFGNDCLLPS